jgi:hypothetical protein
VEFRRVEYDVELAARAIVAGTLPDDFAAYLRTGGMPALATTTDPLLRSG